MSVERACTSTLDDVFFRYNVYFDAAISLSVLDGSVWRTRFFGPHTIGDNICFDIAGQVIEIVCNDVSTFFGEIVAILFATGIVGVYYDEYFV